MDGVQGLPPLAEVQEAAPPGGFQGEALTFFPQAIALASFRVFWRSP